MARRPRFRAQSLARAGMAELAHAADLKVRAGIRQDTLFPPALKGWNDPARPRPATANMFATPPLALPPSANPAFETELSQTLYFGRLVSTGCAGVAEWQTQRT
jgi:hypothetical protein